LNDEISKTEQYLDGTEVSAVFWIAALVMGAVALLLVTRPMTAQSHKVPRSVIAVMVFVPALALALYTLLGTPQAATSQSVITPDTRNAMPSSSMPSSGEKKADSIGNLLAGLEKRLENEPDDAGGWLLLAKSYQHLDRIADAKIAYAKAVALGKTDPAFAAMLNGESGAGSFAPHPEVAPIAIKGKVSIDAELAKQIDPTATVFVFAKAVNGSPMPLAVVRKPVSELPFEFVLDDSLAMVAGMTVSSAKEVEVTAKISSTGNAMQPDAGIAASSGPVTTADAAYLELLITRQQQ
jgi:hypothetical protein